jgi:hypothetical protein
MTSAKRNHPGCIPGTPLAPNDHYESLPVMPEMPVISGLAQHIQVQPKIAKYSHLSKRCTHTEWRAEIVGAAAPLVGSCYAPGCVAAVIQSFQIFWCLSVRFLDSADDDIWAHLSGCARWVRALCSFVVNGLARARGGARKA